ncbi:MAG: hypothetical protein ACJ8BW_06445 [Ktedonobacteraceae bacterium]
MLADRALTLMPICVWYASCQRTATKPFLMQAEECLCHSLHTSYTSVFSHSRGKTEGRTRGSSQWLKPGISIRANLDDSRLKLLFLLRDQLITRLVVEHQDRLTRFGFRYIRDPLGNTGKNATEVVNPIDNNKEDLLHDVASIVSSNCARLYGQRRAKRKAERLVEQLEAKDGES